MDDDPLQPHQPPRRGQMVFAVLFVGFSVLLLISYPSQTVWVEKTRLAAQPRFWPAIGVGGMFVFTLLHLLRLRRRRFVRADWIEARKWLAVFEYAVWFLVYVFAVPVIGYLPASLLFLPALVWRLGYRTRGMLVLSMAMALAIVLLFKTFLDVKIPGGALYEYLPGALRSFFILNF